MAFDTAGNLYIADDFNGRIRKVDSSGRITTVAGGGYGCGNQSPIGDGCVATSAELYDPWGIAIDGAGTLFIADQFHHSIRKVDASNIISTVAGTGVAGFSGDGGLATAAQLNFPTSIALDGAGDLYISDSENNRIRKVDASGIITTVAGSDLEGFSGDGGPATAATLNYPGTVASDGAGNLYITDLNNFRIRKVDVTNALLRFGSVDPGQSSTAQTITVSNIGNVMLTFAQGNAFALSPADYELQNVANECASGGSLAPGASCVLSLVFHPTEAGNRPGTVTLTDDAIGSPQSVALSGMGGAPPMFVLPFPGATLAIVEAVGPGGAAVAFDPPSAMTWNGGEAAVACSPASGSQFPPGPSSVTCTAIDPAAPSLQTTAQYRVLVRDTTPPTLVLPADIAVDATSPSGAQVTYTVTATDLVDPHPVVSCAPASGSIFAIGTTVVACTAMDVRHNTASGSFTVVVKTAAEQVADLITVVNSAGLLQGVAKSLDAKLQDRLNVRHQLDAFIHEVTAQSGKALTVDRANELIANARRIKAVLGGE